jgi:hypothetical protein
MENDLMISKISTRIAGGLLALCVGFGLLSAADPTTSEIMKKGHDKTDGLITKIKASAKDAKWDDAKKAADELKGFGEVLGKNKPPKGSDESWKTLTDKYKTNTAAAAAAVEKKDAAAVNKALGGINCAECHKVHK